MIFALHLELLRVGGEEKGGKRKSGKNKRRHMDGEHGKIMTLTILRTIKLLGKLAIDHEAEEKNLLDSSVSAFWVFNVYFPLLFPPLFLSIYPLIFSPLPSIFFL